MLGEQIRMLREHRGLSQEQIGKRLGVSKQTVSNWENDNVMPSLDMFLRLTDFFHTTPNFLLEYDDHPYIDAQGLTPEERKHVIMIVEDLRSHRKMLE